MNVRMGRWVILVGLLSTVNLWAETPQSSDQTVIARIEDRTITRGRYEDIATFKLNTIYQRNNPMEIAAQRQVILDNLINMQVYVLVAQRAGMTASEKEVQESMDLVRKEYVRPDIFKQMLKNLGTTEAEFPAFSRDMVLVRKFIEKTARGVVVSDAEIAAAYDQMKSGGKLNVPESVEVAHILVRAQRDDATASRTAKEKIETARARIAKGEAFAQVAREVSQDTSAPAGGVIPPVVRGATVPEFERCAFETPPNGLSEPFQTEYGWHILTVKARHGAGAMPLDQVRDGIKERLFDQKRKEALDKAIQDARASMKIELSLPEDFGRKPSTN